MRGSLILLAMLATACADPPGRDGTYVPPPPMPPIPRQTDVIDEIDSARKAAEAQEKIYDDPRFQKWIEDSIMNARNDSLFERLLRERKKQEP